MTDVSAMSNAYAKSKAGECPDEEDNWENTKNKDANRYCPGNNPFVTFGDMKGSNTWWINYHWSRGSGTYANGWFNSIFDPQNFWKKTDEGLTLRAYGTEKGKCITSELVSEAIAPIGDEYKFLVTARVDSGTKNFAALDENVIFGIFTYQYGCTANPNVHQELDLLEIVSKEVAKKTQDGYPKKDGDYNAQFTVQPWDENRWNNIERFKITETQYLTAQMVSWGATSNVIDYALYAGDYSLDDLKNAKLIRKWVVPKKYVPPGGGCPRFHINLYLAWGTPPKEEQRITITRIQYK